MKNVGSAALVALVALGAFALGMWAAHPPDPEGAVRAELLRRSYRLGEYAPEPKVTVRDLLDPETPETIVERFKNKP